MYNDLEGIKIKLRLVRAIDFDFRSVSGDKNQRNHCGRRYI